LSAAEPGEAEAHEVGETHPPLGDGHGSVSAAVQTPQPVVEPAPTEPEESQSLGQAASESSEPEASQSSLPDEMAQ